MIEMEFIWGSLILAAAALGTAAQPAGSPTSGAPAQDAAPESLEGLRARHQVKLVDSKLEGTAIDSLPGGVYGFSHSPQVECPLFIKRTFRSFEVHKLADGEVRLIGYVTPEDAARLASNETFELRFYPDPFDAATRLVALSTERVAKAKGPSRDDGNFLTLTIEPATS